VKYSSIDDAVRMIYKLGTNSLLAKCDIKSAFGLLRLSPGDFDLMGLKFKDQYYFDESLPMDAAVSCALFESFPLPYIGLFKISPAVKIFYIT
jgi:hypothetical protein